MNRYSSQKPFSESVARSISEEGQTNIATALSSRTEVIAAVGVAFVYIRSFLQRCRVSFPCRVYCVRLGSELARKLLAISRVTALGAGVVYIRSFLRRCRVSFLCRVYCVC